MKVFFRIGFFTLAVGLLARCNTSSVQATSGGPYLQQPLHGTH